MADERQRREEETPWNFTKVGAYGIFSTAGSLPMEYLQTTLSTDELPKITFARDVDPAELDFEMLMQRDIDEDRANEKLKGYLSPDEPESKGSKLRHSVFFPPLLVACVPATGNKIQQYYPDESWDDTTPGHLIRRWANLFELDYFTTGSPSAVRVVRSASLAKEAEADLTNVLVKFNLSQAFESGAKLIAIDGQHRLFALKQLAQTAPDTITGLVIPACILFSTTATKAAEGYYQAKSSPSGVPTVAQTFRKIFVDVNSKVEPVGAHTTILLNDTHMGSLIVREFCSLVNQEKQKEGLSCVEWNVRSVKDSTILSRDFSITSIGILHKALNECFGGKSAPALMKRLLDIDDVSVEAQLKVLAAESVNGEVSWETFPLAQRPLLTERAQSGIVDLLFRVFFELDPYSAAYEHYLQLLSNWRERARANATDSPDHHEAYTALTNFKPPPAERKASQLIRTMGKNEANWRRNELSPVMGLALYQRSIVLCLRDMMYALRDLSAPEMGAGFLRFLSIVMSKELNLFGKDKAYTNRTVWSDTGRVVNREKTRRQMARLALAVLADKKRAMQVSTLMATDSDDQRAYGDRLVKVGEESAREFWREYTKDQEAYFRRSYATSVALDAAAVDELNRARELQDEETRQIESETLTREDARWPFDLLVRKHLADVLDDAEYQLRDVLRIEKHIVASEVAPEDDGEDADE